MKKEILDASPEAAVRAGAREAVLAQIAEPRRIMSERTDPTGLSQVAAIFTSLPEVRMELGRFGEAVAAWMRSRKWTSTSSRAGQGSQGHGR